jgi:hypothetical protein
MPRKYYLEFALNSYVTWGALLQQGDFNYLNIPFDKNPQIYLIGKRPRITCDPNSLHICKDGHIALTALVHRLDGIRRISFSAPIIGNLNNVELHTSYPYTSISSQKGGIEKSGSISVAALLSFQPHFDNENLDLEILYIGQSDSESSKYTIRDRIENHSTLQKIYSEVIKSYPNDEIWIALFHFEINVINSFGGLTKSTASPEEDDAHAKRYLNSTLPDSEMINLTEAALIRYFQPSFNKVYKNSFPNPSHSTYLSCYKLEIREIFVAFLTDSIRCRVYTDAVGPSVEHGVKYLLRSREDIAALLSILY